MGEAQGKKVASTALRLRRSRRSRSSARSSHQRGYVRPRADPQSYGEAWLSRCWWTRGRNDSARKEKQSPAKGGIVSQERIEVTSLRRGYVGQTLPATWPRSSEEDCLSRAQVSIIFRSPRRFARTCSTMKAESVIPSGHATVWTG